MTSGKWAGGGKRMSLDRGASAAPLPSWDEQAVRQVLEGVAETVCRGSPYRRAVVSFYERPLAPGSAAASRVVEYAARGLRSEDERTLLLFLANGGLVSAEKLQPRFRLGCRIP